MFFCFFMSLLSGLLSVFSLDANRVAGNEFHTCVQRNSLLFYPLTPRVIAKGYGVRARSIEGQTLLLRRYASFIFNFFLSLGPYFVGVTHSFNAENSPKCFRTQLVKSLGEDDVGSGLFRCSTRDSNQSFRDLPTVFYCSIRLLNNASIVWMDGWNPKKSAPRNTSRFEKSHYKTLPMLESLVENGLQHAWNEQTA